MSSTEKVTDTLSPASSRRSGRWFWPVVILTLVTGSAAVLLVSQGATAPATAAADAPSAPRAVPRYRPVTDRQPWYHDAVHRQLSRVRVEVVAALKDSASIRAGQPVRLAVQGMAGEQFTGVVDRVSPVAEAGTRSIKVYLSLDSRLRGGMFVTGEIVVRQDEDVIAAPASAHSHA